MQLLPKDGRVSCHYTQCRINLSWARGKSILRAGHKMRIYPIDRRPSRWKNPIADLYI